MAASSSTSVVEPALSPVRRTIIPPKFRGGISLYDYQVESLEWIANAEEKHVYHDVNGHIPLTEPFGSGKTFIILALIAHSPIPPIARVHLYNEITTAPYVSFGLSHTNQLIRPTAIVIARSVYAQWIKNIETYTSLRYFEARDKPSTIKLIDMIMNGDINDYDIVLVKYGRTQDEESRFELCKLINQKTIPLIWSRVVYDDVDLIVESACMRAISSIFVTGATDFTYYRHGGYVKKKSDKEISFDMHDLLINLPPVSHIFSSVYPGFGSMWATLGHSPDEIARNHGIYAMRWLVCSITNAEIHRASNLIQGIEAVDCTELLNMINGDAMVSAAKMLHINAASPSAMFASVLGTQRETYETVVSRLEILERIRAIPNDDRHDMHNMLRRSPDPEEDAISQQQRREEMFGRIGVPRELINRAEKPTTRPKAESNRNAILDIEGGFHIDDIISASDAELDEQLARVRAYRDRLDRSFLRIKENISSQACSVCYESLESAHVAIMRCCGFTVCSTCCARASRFAKTDDNRIVGMCIQCRQPLDLVHDVIFVDSSTHAGDLIQKVIDSKGHCEDPTDRASPASVEANGASSSSSAEARAAHTWDDHITTKIGYVVALIRNQIRGLTANDGFARDSTTTLRIGNTLRIQQTEVPVVRGVMNGTQLVPPPDGDRMFLICTSFDEAIDDITLALTEANIDHEVLNGSVREFADKLGRFTRREVHVLIINVHALYAGVDLQCATDIVLVSRTDIENLGQIIGRAQRLGRTCSLTVHTLEYVSSPDGENGASHSRNIYAAFDSKQIKKRSKCAKMRGNHH